MFVIRHLLARSDGCHRHQRKRETRVKADPAPRTLRHEILKAPPQRGGGGSFIAGLWHEHHEDIDREHDDVDHSE
jgi:hypothetical protein